MDISLDDLQLVVAVANIAGHLEAHKRIAFDDDAQLTIYCRSVVKGYREWIGDGMRSDFYEYAAQRLLELAED